MVNLLCKSCGVWGTFWPAEPQKQPVLLSQVGKEKKGGIPGQSVTPTVPVASPLSSQSQNLLFFNTGLFEILTTVTFQGQAITYSRLYQN